VDDPIGRLRPETMTDDELTNGLLDLGRMLASPSIDRGGTALDPAARARLRLVATAPGRDGGWWQRPPTALRLRRAIVLAAVAVVVVAAIAGAIGLGLPGIRIVPASSAPPTLGSSASPAPSASRPIGGPLGSGLGLGDPIALADAGRAAGISVVLPSATGVGPPAAAWLLDGRLSLVWPSGPALPTTREPGIGLILAKFRGSINPGYFEKITEPGTTVEPAEVGGVTGYWISGTPHQLVFVDPVGVPIFDSRRIVGDTLLWARDGVTYRLESGLDRAAAIALAETLR
jgi:hypothetical protein